MDITKLYTVESHEAGAEMQIQDQYGEDVELFITVVGIDSKRWKKSYFDSRKLLLKDSEIDSDSVALANAVIGWRGFTDSNNIEIPFTVDAVKNLFTNAPYIKQQVDLFMGSRINFTQG